MKGFGLQLQKLLIQNRAISPLKAMIIGCLESEVQEHGIIFTLYHALRKIGISLRMENMQSAA